MSWRDVIAKAITGIKAYHGSPHDFNRFDPTKIGTGEGAQSFGHGLYFAENPETARSYRDALAGNNYDTGYHNLDAMLNAGRSWSGMRSQFGENAKLMKLMNDVEEAGRHNPIGSAGKMYEVNINADPKAFLDWDKPLSQQSDYVREAFSPQRLGLKAAGPLGDRGWYGWTDAKDRLIGRAQTKDWPAEIFDPGEGGQGLYRGGGTWKPAEASDILSASGVPGIKYLDQGSRFAQPTMTTTPHGDVIASQYPPKTSNYVVFPGSADIIDITRKYGLAAPVGLGALAAQDQYETQP